MDTASIAAIWREDCLSTDVWIRADSQAGAADAIADGFYMVSEAIGWRRAYVKPRSRGGPRGRPAREKIASDLAFDLEVPVAPVVLVERHDAGTTEERHVCASLVMFPSQQPLWAVRRALSQGGRSKLGEKARLTLSQDAARGIAFDTWVGQTDHHPRHPHNIILGWDQEQRSSFVFLDYEYAFGGSGGGWRGARSRDCAIAPFPDEFLEDLDPSVLDEMVTRIEGISGAAIERVIARIPTAFLNDAQKDEVLEGLLARQPLVRSALRGKL